MWELINSNVISIAIGGFVLYLVTNRLNDRTEKRKQKKEIFHLLVATKNFNDYERIKVLNLIPIIFKYNDNVVTSYRNYINEISAITVDYNKVTKTQNDLITQIGRDINYYKKSERYINDSEYNPQWMTNFNQQQLDYQRVLKYQLREYEGKFNDN